MMIPTTPVLKNILIATGLLIGFIAALGLIVGSGFVFIMVSP